MAISERKSNIIKFYIECDYDVKKTSSNFGITEQTVKKYEREWKKQYLADCSKDEALKKLQNKEVITKNRILDELSEKYTLDELKAINGGYDPTIKQLKDIKIDHPTNSIKIGLVSDTHIGSKHFIEEWWDFALSKFDEEGVDIICHSGDLVEGLSDRKGHWYDLSHIGYEPQKKYAIQILNKTKIPIYGIDGNHDRWFIKSANAMICQDISEHVEHYHFLGSDYGDIYLNDKVFIRLVHGEDGNSYALSYRVQKIIESLSPDDNPSLLFLGHVHKAVSLPATRGIYSYSAGALSKQSNWMRSKKIENHAGFWILDVKYNSERVTSCKSEFFNLQEPHTNNNFRIQPTKQK